MNKVVGNLPEVLVQFDLDSVFPNNPEHRARLDDARVERDADGSVHLRLEFAPGWQASKAYAQQDHLEELELLDRGPDFYNGPWPAQNVRVMAGQAQPCQCQHCASAKQILRR